MAAKLAFGAGQVLMASSYIVLAFLLKFNLLDVQTSLGIPEDALNFHVVILLAFGVVLIFGGLFLVFDWRESG